MYWLRKKQQAWKNEKMELLCLADTDVCGWQGAYDGGVIKGYSVCLWDGKCLCVESSLLEIFRIGHVTCSSLELLQCNLPGFRC